MEKLKVTHNHSLTDILKVLIFAIVLLIPGFMFLPSMLYFGMNEQANAPTKEEEINKNIEVNFNQTIYNGNFENTANWAATRLTFSVNDNIASISPLNSTTYDNYLNQNTPFDTDHKYLISFENYCPQLNRTIFLILNGSASNQISISSTIVDEWETYYRFFTGNEGTLDLVRLMNTNTDSSIVYQYKNVMLFDLTLIYGRGYEPSTYAQFLHDFPNEYYETQFNTPMIIEEGTIETVVDITTQLEYNWEQIWQKPLLSWTNRSILKNGLDNFTSVFGIDNNSYITNLLTYELIMVGVYIVIDIVLTLFKWLTHMIGNK